jgi:hypothetical protein
MSDPPAQPTPDLIAEVRLYAPDQGGRTTPIRSTFRCPCAVTNVKPAMMHSAELLLGSEPMNPGQSRRLGFAFLTPDGADAMRQAGKFYLWDGRFFAEAVIVQ